MRCKNKVEIWVDKGYHGKLVSIKCHSTGPRGELILCPSCTKEAYDKHYHNAGDITAYGVRDEFGSL